MDFSESNLRYQPDELGSGAFATVYRVVDSNDNEYAVKEIDKRNLDEGTMNTIKHENKIASEVDHPNLVKTHLISEKNRYIRIYMDFYQGGNVEDLMNQTLDENEDYIGLDECNVYVIFSQLVEAVKYLHLEKEIVHRDIKLENMFFKRTDGLELVLGDFGFSEHLKKGDLLYTFPGSPVFSPPELFKGIPNEGYPADIWSMGVCLYAMSTGKYPFDLKYNRMSVVDTEPDLELVKNELVQDLLRQMLNKDRYSRPDIMGVYNHPWMVKWRRLKEEGAECDKITNEPIFYRSDYNLRDYPPKRRMPW